MDPAHAAQLDKIERTSEALAADQENLKSGKIKKEDYEKSLAQKKEEVAQIATQWPKSAPMLTGWARFDDLPGDFPKAIEHASSAIELAPKDPFPLTTRGLARFHSGDFPKAAADAERALVLDPGNAVAKAIYELSKDRVAGSGAAGIKDAFGRAGRDLVALPESAYAAAASLPPESDPEVAAFGTERGRKLARQIVAAERAMRRKDYWTAFGRANTALALYGGDNPRIQAVRAVSAWNLGEYRTTIADATKVM